ncbi:hypothetical protein B8V81_2062 [Paenibacillus pasadenensis]|uniref:Uncharacterized protein n=1 Tax=Paenibacillus pasadenensis TaxID=217090 RepID=A0A2N5MZW9_9BACL|nr:hypothetical protein B8V81_2062 [Paenibacillus pasadenensis]
MWMIYKQNYPQSEQVIPIITAFSTGESWIDGKKIQTIYRYPQSCAQHVNKRMFVRGIIRQIMTIPIRSCGARFESWKAGEGFSTIVVHNRAELHCGCGSGTMEPNFTRPLAAASRQG